MSWRFLRPAHLFVVHEERTDRMNHVVAPPGTADLATESARNTVDLLDALAGIQSGTALDQLRRRRPEIAQHIQGSYAVLLQPEEVGGLSLVERGMAALRSAALAGSGPLVHHYREYLIAQQASAQLVEALLSGDTEAETSRARAILRHVDLLTEAPGAAAPADLAALAEQGLRTPEIVTLAQLIAFVSFQARVLAGLLLLDGRPAASGHSRHSPSVENIRRSSDFTLDELAWIAWLDTVDPAAATPRQLEVLEASHSRASTSPYYLLLVHNAELLYQRSLLFNAVMYGREGLPRAERELATVAVSRINGCPYCASVHARLFVQLTKQPDVIYRLYEQGVGAEQPPRLRALVDFAARLTDAPDALNGVDLLPLRQNGLSDLEILDLIHAVAMFAWANRLMQTLGEPAPLSGAA